MAGELLNFPRRNETISSSDEEEMVAYLIEKIKEVREGRIKGFVFGAHGPGVSFVAYQGDMVRGDTLWMAANLALKALGGLTDAG